MPTRSADASWHGSLAQGHGNVRTQSGALEGAYSAPSRFADGDGTNPEELLGAAHAGCYAMALSGLLGEHGYSVDHIDARADVTIEEIDGQPSIRSSELKVVGYVADIDEHEFNRLAEEAKAHCPVSRALAGLDISLRSELGT
jgi:lipoyl-dependent peroxiredoxin